MTQPAPPRTVTTPWPGLALVVTVGLITGALTQLGQGLLPEGLSQVANAIAPWLLVSFLLGSAMPSVRWAAVTGVVSLGLALIGYYAMIELRFGYGASTSSLVFWGLGALVGGVLYGAAGFVWRQDSRDLWRAAALGLAGAVFVAEAGYIALVLGQPQTAMIFAVVGSLLPAVLGRSRADRLGGTVAIAPAVLLGALGYAVFIGLNGVTAGIG